MDNTNKLSTNVNHIPNPMFFNSDNSIRADIEKDLIRNETTGKVIGVRELNEQGSVTQAYYNIQSYAEIKLEKDIKAMLKLKENGG
jgi:hypothetical protein